MLQVNKISLHYNKVKVVSNVTFDLFTGQKLVIVGASGCGKTTLLKAIAGYMPIAKGEVLFNAKKVLDPSEQLVPGHELIKLVNQDFNLDQFHTVEENIRLKILQFDKNYIINRVEELLRITELTNYKNYKANQLSGGQKQRLAIARALASEPELLLLDEPFNQLDYHLKLKVERYIFKYLKKYNIGCVLVTHNGEEAMRWADEIAFMKKGKFIRINTPSNFYNSPQNKYEAAFFGEINTVILNNKQICFRPHEFAKKQKKNYSINLSVKYINSIDKGWYISSQFLVGKKQISLYSKKPLNKINNIWVKEVNFF